MKRLAKRILNKLLMPAGYQLVACNRLEQATFAQHIRSLIEILDIHCVLDVGAHTGEYRDFLRSQVGYEGWIVSFEPVAASFSTLIEAAKADDRWVVCDFALGAENRTRQINVMKFDGLSSFLTPDNRTVHEFGELNVIDHFESVQVKTLDSAMESLAIEYPQAFTPHGLSTPRTGRPPDLFLKIDTQGHDLEVVAGAGATLPRIAALQTELSVQPIYEHMHDYLEALRELERIGFDVTSVCPVSRDSLLRIIEWDCILVNRGVQR